jgi:DNA-binding NarL/FixJ family response regulator
VIRVVVADDQVLVRGGFALILGADPQIDVVAEAGDGVEALAAVRDHSPDVVLMDIRMPGMDGIEATRHLTTGPATAGNTERAQAGRTRVLVLTTFDADEYIYQALEAGASGFLLKDTTPADLIAAVKTVARGDALLSPTITRRLIESYLQTGTAAAGTPAAAAPAELAELTPRERDILAAVARGQSNHEIADDLYLSYSTVKTHISRLFSKLGARDRTQLVIRAYQAGVTTDSG